MKFIRPLSQTTLISDANLVSYWTLDGNANDYKNVNNGTSVNVTYGGQYAQFGQGGLFNANNYITIANSTSLNFGTSDITISLWIKTSQTTDSWIIDKSNTVSPFQGIYVGFVGGKFSFAITDCGTGGCGWGSTRSYVQALTSISDNSWHLITCVRTSTTYYLYIDGVLNNTRTEAARNADSTAPMYFRNFTGNIDEVSIFNRALTAAEVAYLAAGETFINNRPLADTRFFTDANLVSYWKLDGNSNDSKGTKNGTDTAITYGSQYGVFNQGALFNGSSSNINFNAKAMPIGAKTISLWFNSSYTANYQYIYDDCDGTSVNNGTTLVALITSGYFQFWSVKGTSGTPRFNVITTVNVCDGYWHHIVCTWDGTTTANMVKIYVDGVLNAVGTAAATETVVSTQNSVIGKPSTTTPYYTNGSIDDFAIFSRALSYVEVQELYEIEKIRSIYRPLSQTRYVDDPNLVSYWKLNGNSNDSKGIYNLTDTSVTYVSRGFGTVGLYNGTSSASSIANNLGITGGVISVSAWFNSNVTSSSTAAAIFSHYDDTAKVDYRILLDSGGGVAAARHAPNVGWNATTATPIIDGVWYHVVLTYNGTILSLYLNGVLKNSVTATATGTGTYTTQTLVGKGGASSTSAYFNGLIQDVAVFNKALSAEEIAEIYQLQSRGISVYSPQNDLYGTYLRNDINLVSYWKMDGNSKDNKGSNNASAESSTTYSSSISKFGQSVYFNGSNAYLQYGVTPFSFGTADFSISIWFYCAQTSGDRVIYAPITGTKAGIWLFSRIGANGLSAEYWTSAGAVGSNYSSVNVNNNSWHHAVITRSSTTMSLYCDGILLGTSTIAAGSILTPSNGYTLGYSSYMGTYYAGYIDDFSVFSRALSASEVNIIYKGIADPNLRPLESIPSLRNDSSLVSYWKLDGNPNDSKGTNNGTATSVTYGVGVNGNFINCGIFNGSSSYIDVGNGVSLQLGAGPFTISAWFKKAANGTVGSIYHDNAGTSNYYSIGTNSNNTLFLYVAGDSGYTVLVSTTSTITDTNWHLLTCVIESSTSRKIYLDGVLNVTNTTNIVGSISSNRTKNIGRNTSNVEYFNGSIDDVVIFNRALTAQEIQTLYTGIQYINKRPLADTRFYTDANLVSYWKLDGNSTDSKGTNNGTDTAITYGTQYGIFGQGASFNGSTSKVEVTPISLGNSYTISAWINLTGTNANDALFVFGQPNTYGFNENLYVNNTGLVISYIRDSSNNQTYAISSTPVIKNIWCHIVCTVDWINHINRVYINGIVAGSNTAFTGTKLSDSFGANKSNIGNHGTNTYPFNGYIDDISIFNRALSIVEVQELYEIEKVRSIYRPLEQTRFRNDDSLVSYWKLDGNSTDSKGGYNGTDTAVTYEDGHFNKVASFNGSSSYISIPASTSLNGQNDHTLTAWFKLNSLPATNTSMQIALKGNDYPSTSGVGWGLRVNVQNDAGTNYFVAYCVTTNPSTTGYYARTSSVTMQIGVWYHIVAVFDNASSKIRLFLNGVFMGETSTGTILRTGNGALIGAYQASATPSEVFNGLIDDVSLFTRALSREEVAELYQSQTIGEIEPLSYKPQGGLYATSLINDANLVSYWKMDGNSRDSKGTNHGTDTSMAYASSYGKFGQGGYFNGSGSKISFGDTTALRFGTGEFSLSFWMKVNSTVTNVALWNKDPDGTRFYINLTSNVLTFVNLLVSGNLTSPTALIAGYWYHVAVTRTNGGVIVAYLNGIQIATATGTNKDMSAIGTNWTISSANNYYFNGMLDDSAMFSRALTASEVFEIYSKGESSPFRPLDAVPTLRQDSSLVSYWKLNGDAADGKGTNNGTATNVTYSVGVNGRFGQAGVFNGSSIINVGNGASLQITVAITVSCWVKTSQTATYAGFLGKMSTGAPNYGWLLRMNNSAYPEFGISSTGSNYVNAVGTSAINDGQWHHVIGIFIPSTSVRIYLDGRLVGINTTSIPASIYNTTGAVTIGASYSNTTETLTGSIDDACIFNRALTGFEVYQLYTQGSTVGYWKLNGSSTDYSGNGNHGTDTAITYAQGNGLLNQGAFFNGTSSKIVLPIGVSFAGTQTISCFVNIPYTPSVSDKYIVCKNSDYLSTNYLVNGWGLRLVYYTDASGYIKFATTCVEVDGTNIVAPAVEELTFSHLYSNWYHLVAVYNKGNQTLSLYVNSEYIGQTSLTSTYVMRTSKSGGDGGYIGSFRDSSANYGYWATGSIDEVIIENRAWSASEIRKYCASRLPAITLTTLTIPTSGLVLNLDAGNTKSYPGSGTVWTDMSSNALTFNSAGTFPTYEIKNGHASFAFNGSGYWYCGTNYSLVDLGGDFTLILWLFGEDVTVRKTIFEKAGTSYQSYQQELAMTWEVDESMSYYSRYSPNYDYGNAPVGTMPTNGWIMFGLKMTTGKSSTARNGYWSKNGSAWTQAYTSNSNLAVLASGQIRIGTGYAGTMDNGNVAMVLAYNRLLSDAEISQIYAVTVPTFTI